MLGFDAISESAISELPGGIVPPPAPTLIHHPGQRFKTPAERRRIREKAQAELARQERMWAEAAQERDDLRGQLLDVLHPERIEARIAERERLQRQISETMVYDNAEDEADVEFLLLHA